MIEIIITNSTVIDPFFLRQILSREQNLELNPNTLSHSSLQHELANTSYDIALVLPLDTSEGVIDLVDKISKYSKDTKTIVVTTECQPEYIKHLQSKGVHGILKSDSLKEKLVDAINVVNSEKKYLDTSICEKEKEKELNRAKNSVISDREKEIISYITNGYTSKQIADKLCISEHTVKSHRKNINHKLQVHSPTQLLKYAIENKIGI
ncbi:MAG: response regulator transcription factor [Bacteroidia bacterium]|nr:response regulator transcription factor [Bacteroidia bacterium]